MDSSRNGENSSEPDLGILFRLSWLENWALWTLLAVAAGVLALWFLPAVAVYAPSGWSKMTANTAVALLLATAGLILSTPARSPMALRASQACAVLVLALGLLTLSEYAGAPFSIDHWLPTDAASRHPGRPSPQTAVALVLVGIGLISAPWVGRRLSFCADLCSIALITLVLFLLGGHIFQAVQLIGVDKSTLSSPHTILSLAMLAFIVASRRASRGGLLSFWMDRGIGSRIARSTLPGIVAAPFILFALIASIERSGLLNVVYIRAVMAPILVLAAGAVVAWMGLRANELERQLRLQSLTDQLTDVLNRRGFYAVADYALRNATRLNVGLILFYFDLDGLKKINDNFGHAAGSSLIRSFAAILASTFRKNDVVGRIGGDEFVVLASDRAGAVTAILDRLAMAVAKSNAAGTASSRISYSAGYSNVDPLTDVTIDDLIGRADAMMYQEKVRKENAPIDPRKFAGSAPASGNAPSLV